MSERLLVKSAAMLSSLPNLIAAHCTTRLIGALGIEISQADWAFPNALIVQTEKRSDISQGGREACHFCQRRVKCGPVGGNLMLARVRHSRIIAKRR